MLRVKAIGTGYNTQSPDDFGFQQALWTHLRLDTCFSPNMTGERKYKKFTGNSRLLYAS
jgi:hypothetical protein